ncbi:polysaccharide export protein EpsE [Sulfuriferula sp. AH1]|nr:polysaccharide export protein EpsE [Sulfuriferula sp. AH1]
MHSDRRYDNTGFLIIKTNESCKSLAGPYWTFRKADHIMRKLFYFLIVMLAAFALPAHADEYRLGVGDVVHITVYDHPDLLVDAAQIDEDGKIAVPLLGSVQIAGLTASAAQKRIAQGLESGGFIVKPNVNLVVKEYRSKLISILGQVNKPGKYALESTSTITDLLAQAGGISSLGSDTVVLVHKNGNQLEQTKIDTLSLFNDGQLAMNSTIHGGDIIYVPRAEVFYIYGEVQHPGSFRLQKDMNLMQAIAMGGGITLRGTERGAQIRRKDKDGKTITLPATEDTQILPDDVVYIKESLF